MAPRTAALLRTLAGVVVVVVVVAAVGGDAVRAAVAGVSPGAALAATALGALTTLAIAWRWQLLARGLGLDLPLGAAVAASYRAQLVNGLLPGGVVGDVHRAARHGLDAGDLPRAATAVLLDRVAGQAVLVPATAASVVAVPALLVPAAASARAARPVAAGALVVLAVVALAVVTALRSGRLRGPRADAVRRLAADARRAVTRPGTAAGVVVSSCVALGCFVATFLVAARAAGVDAPLGVLVPPVLVALLATAVPLNVGGWGPREGAAAWAFAAVGLDAAQGLTVSVLYGLLVVVQALPGAVVLAVPVLAGTRRPGPGTAPDAVPAVAAPPAAVSR